MKIVHCLLDAGADIEERASKGDGRTALQIAAGEDETGIVSLLLNFGADVNAPPSPMDGLTTLQIAVRGRSIPIVKLLLDAGADIDAEGSHADGQTALHFALEFGEPFAMAAALLVAGANINTFPSPQDGLTALQVAVRAGSLNVVKYLLYSSRDRGAVNDRALPPDDRTLLETAVDGGYFDIVTTLINAGADVNPAPSPTGGRTALGFAVHNRSRELIMELLQAGTLPTRRNHEGWTVIHDLCAVGETDILEYMLALRGTAGNERNHDGSTALHIAVTEQKLNCIELLIKVGVNLDIVDNSGTTPLGIALSRQYYDVMRRLLQAGARTDSLPIQIWDFLWAPHSPPNSCPAYWPGPTHDNRQIYYRMIEETWGPISQKRSLYFPV